MVLLMYVNKQSHPLHFQHICFEGKEVSEGQQEVKHFTIKSVGCGQFTQEDRHLETFFSGCQLLFYVTLNKVSLLEGGWYIISCDHNMYEKIHHDVIFYYKWFMEDSVMRM